MNLIRHIIEPERLLLSWQAPEGAGNRSRHLVGALTRRKDGTVELAYAPESEDFRKAVKLGFDGHPAFKDTNKAHRSGVLETFMRRLPPRSRTDFHLYLEQLRLPPDAKISDFALLGYSGARLPGDSFSLIHPFDEVDGPCELVTEVAGTRYQKDFKASDVRVGDAVTFVADPNNAADKQAIRIVASGVCVGFVSRGLLPAFHRWLEYKAVPAQIERVNGTIARPSVYLFVEVLGDRQAQLAA